LLTGQDPLVGNEGTFRPGRKERFEVLEGVTVGGHLRKGAEGETGRSFHHGAGSFFGRAFQSQAVANVLVHTPKLSAPGQCFGQQSPQRHELVPTFGGDVAFDYADEFVSVGSFDRIMCALCDRLGHRH
jgi:hypothetical protein